MKVSYIKPAFDNDPQNEEDVDVDFDEPELTDLFVEYIGHKYPGNRKLAEEVAAEVLEYLGIEYVSDAPTFKRDSLLLDDFKEWILENHLED